MNISIANRVRRGQNISYFTPSLNLLSGKSLDSYDLVNFTRSGTKTYFDSNGVLQTASANTLPTGYEYDGSNWVRKGWLIEESRTNELVDSRDMTTAPWGIGGATAARDAVGIDGVANTACTITDIDGSGFDWREQTITIPNDSNFHVGYVYVKKTQPDSNFGGMAVNLIGGTTIVRHATIIDHIDGSIADINNDGKAFVEDAGDWWRLWIRVQNNSTGNTQLEIKLYGSLSSDGTTTDSSLTGSTVYDQAQVELNKSFPSSPIITGGSQVTRPADIADITDLSWYNQDEGTFVVGFSGGEYDTFSDIFTFLDDINNRIYLRREGSGQIAYIVRESGVLQILSTFISDWGGEELIFGGVYNQDDFAYVVNGGSVGTDSGGNVPQGIASVVFNNNFYLKSLKYYPKRLSNSQLQALTS